MVTPPPPTFDLGALAATYEYGFIAVIAAIVLLLVIREWHIRRSLEED